MKFDISTLGDEKFDRYNIIKALFQPQVWIGINFTPSTSKSLICIFLPSDPVEVVDQMKLL